MTSSAYDILDQFEFSTGEYLETVVDKYAPLVGLFLIRFSEFELDLNIAIADFLHEDSHETGFVIVGKLSVTNKIDLFYKLYSRLETLKAKSHKITLKGIKGQAEEINSFRNDLVHANWQSLTKEGFVRTKIVIDNNEGYVKFKKVSVKPSIIRKKIREVEKLITQLDEYTETAFEF